MTAHEGLLRKMARCLVSMADDDAGRMLRFVLADLFDEEYETSPEPDYPDAAYAVYAALREDVAGAAAANRGPDA